MSAANGIVGEAKMSRRKLDKVHMAGNGKAVSIAESGDDFGKVMTFVLEMKVALSPQTLLTQWPLRGEGGLLGGEGEGLR
jgi:hypothetical protein